MADEPRAGPEGLAQAETASTPGIDRLFAAARRGDTTAFGHWMARVERPLRATLVRFARAADLEVVMQETLLRMWLVARDPRRTLEGTNASLRFALRVARNVALEEVRRGRLGALVSLDALEDTDEPAVLDEPPPDHGLRRAILACLERLPRKPREAILARLERGHGAPDRDLAQRLGMKLNTFLQNVVRARAQLAACLRSQGVDLEGVAS